MAETAAEQIKKLKLERGQCKGKLTRFESFLDSFTPDKLSQLESRLDDLMPLLEQFSNIQFNIEYLNSDERESNNQKEFEDKYYDLVGVAKQKIRDLKQPFITTPTNTVNANSSSSFTNTDIQSKPNVKLPTVQLPVFDGTYEHWEYFRDMFIALVHNDTSIDNVRKFYYLSSALAGAAAKAIKSIPITNDNYTVAWQILKDRFEDKEIIIRNHIKAIVEMKHVSGDLKVTLREFTDDIQIHLRSLESLGEPVEHWSSILNYIIWKKLDLNTQNDWEEYLITKKLKQPKFTIILEFLVERCKFLEKRDKTDNEKNRVYNQHKSFENRNKTQNYHQHRKQAVSHFVTNRAHACSFCKGEHQIYFCENLKKLPLTARVNEIKKLMLCTNCLRSNHFVKDCNAQGCKKCGKKHNTLLHIENDLKTSFEEPQNSFTSSGASTSKANISNLVTSEIEQNVLIESQANLSHVCRRQEQQIILSTALISIFDAHGNPHTCRALLDSGSQPNFITKSLCDKLKLKTNKTNIPIIGVGKSTTSVVERVNTKIKSLQEDFKVNLSFLIIEKITENLPTCTFDKLSLKLPSDILLADINFNENGKIDLLLGAELFYDLLKADRLKLGLGLPTLQSTVFGWIISGPFSKTINHNLNKASCNLAINNDLNFNLERFWKIEETQNNAKLSVEDQICENSYKNTTERDSNGRFVVDLPIKENSGTFGESVTNAVKRLYAMERKFGKNDEFKQKYIEFMQEYETLGHMSKINPSEYFKFNSNSFYLPHHGVLNEDSLTTKLRVVFDGSCKSANGLSLNDILLTGPTVQEDLFNILIRFRKHNFVITADIAKMYRQVLVNEKQRDYQRIVWRNSSEEPVVHYR